MTSYISVTVSLSMKQIAFPKAAVMIFFVKCVQNVTVIIFWLE